jgi:hypothetical protein
LRKNPVYFDSAPAKKVPGAGQLTIGYFPSSEVRHDRPIITGAVILSDQKLVVILSGVPACRDEVEGPAFRDPRLAGIQ